MHCKLLRTGSQRGGRLTPKSVAVLSQIALTRSHSNVWVKVPSSHQIWNSRQPHTSQPKCTVALLNSASVMTSYLLVAKDNCIQKIPHVSVGYKDNVYVALRKPRGSGGGFDNAKWFPSTRHWLCAVWLEGHKVRGAARGQVVRIRILPGPS